MDESDHRILGKRLDLFHFQDEAPGMVFWHPRGLAIVRVLEEAVRDLLRADGYREVRTPQVLRRPIWEASGHWQHFYDGMFRIADDASESALKPVSCPGHIAIAANGAPSYRDLPLRFAELGVVHRDEPGGTLHGLMRLRQFTQDDGHVFCEPQQVAAEVDRFVAGLFGFYRAFGFTDVALGLSTRPEQRVGDDAAWDRAEAILAECLDRRGVDWRLQPGQGAFYGPKIEVSLKDRAGREWQCGTIQVDFAMAERFGLAYVDRDGRRRAVAMLHRAMYGSLERFVGILLEHFGARLPGWLAPVQALVLPVGEAQHAYAQRVVSRLCEAGLRAELSAGDESLARRIALAHECAAAEILVVGAREEARETVAWRKSDGGRECSLAEAVDLLRGACARPRFTP